MDGWKEIYDIVGGISLMFVIPIMAWTLVKLWNVSKDVAVLESQMKSTLAENLRRHTEITLRFDKQDQISEKILNRLTELQLKFSAHNGWERHRAEDEDNDQ